MRMRSSSSSSRPPSLAISHRRSCGQDKSNCQLRIMPEGMKKCTRFAPYGVEQRHQSGEYELRARDGCASSGCSLMETATAAAAAAAAPGSYQRVAVDCMCSSASCSCLHLHPGGGRCLDANFSHTISKISRTAANQVEMAKRRVKLPKPKHPHSQLAQLN